MDPVEVKEQVSKALDGEGAAPVPAETPKEVASPEVKVEAPKEPVVVDKKEEQISNLNAALKEEREARKVEAEARKKIESEFNEAKPIIDRFKNFIAPEESAPIDQKPKYMTEEEFNTAWQQKQEEQKQLTFKEKQSEIIKSEVATLEKEWDGTNGKPKYLDQEVLQWQQEHQKLYLSPAEAFETMKKNEIIDWEVNQRLSGKKKVENVEQPGVSPDIHTPGESLPQTDKELRQAIEAAVNMADAEM